MWELLGPLTKPNVPFWGWLWLGVFLANPGHFCGWGAIFWCRNPLSSSDNFTYGHLKKTKWLVSNVIAIGSPGRAERAILGDILAGRVFAGLGHVCGRWATLWCRNLLLSSSNFKLSHLVKIEWLVANVTVIGSPGIAEHAIWGGILAGRVFGQLRTYFWSLSHFEMQEPPLEF